MEGIELATDHRLDDVVALAATSERAADRQTIRLDPRTRQSRRSRRFGVLHPRWRLRTDPDFADAIMKPTVAESGLERRMGEEGREVVRAQPALILTAGRTQFSKSPSARAGWPAVASGRVNSRSCSAESRDPLAPGLPAELECRATAFSRPERLGDHHHAHAPAHEPR
jgi:hypothetical protein